MHIISCAPDEYSISIFFFLKYLSCNQIHNEITINNYNNNNYNNYNNNNYNNNNNNNNNSLVTVIRMMIQW